MFDKRKNEWASQLDKWECMKDREGEARRMKWKIRPDKNQYI